MRIGLHSVTALVAISIWLSDSSGANSATLALYSFDTGPSGATASTIVDSSGNNLNGSILTGAPTYNSTAPLGGGPHSISLSTGSSMVFNYAFPFNVLTNATLQFWINPSSIGGESDVFWTTNVGGDTNRFNILINSTGQMYIDYRDAGGVIHLGLTSSLALVANQWSLVRYVKQGGHLLRLHQQPFRRAGNRFLASSNQYRLDH